MAEENSYHKIFVLVKSGSSWFYRSFYYGMLCYIFKVLLGLAGLCPVINYRFVLSISTNSVEFLGILNDLLS